MRRAVAGGDARPVKRRRCSEAVDEVDAQALLVAILAHVFSAAKATSGTASSR